jgi:epoxide hydrolase-like predicted phosphatase
MVKAVIFDFFGVICSDEYWQTIKEDSDISDKFEQLSSDVNLGKISWNDFIWEVAEETGRDAAAVKKMYEEQSMNPQLLTYINDLRNNYKLALLTNASKGQLGPLVSSVGLDKLFDEIFISSELGMTKPDHRIFEHALEKMNVKPSETVFVDDLEKHVSAAKDLGINSILYEDFQQMKQELEKILAVSDK